MQKLSEENILNALKVVNDPDLHRDIVSLGFVKNVAIKGNDVVLIVTVPGQQTGRLSGKLMSATKMSGTVTGWNSNGAMLWSAEKKK